MFEKVGLALEILRKLRGMSQATLAQAAGIGKGQISKYENGKELPKLDTLEKLLGVLRVSVMTFAAVLDFLEKSQQLDLAEDAAGERLSFDLLPQGDLVGEAFAAIMRNLLALHKALLRSAIDGRHDGRS
jgi:transcriptional regulator with XRE-family HTH domain